jgi:hypothetical protein
VLVLHKPGITKQGYGALQCLLHQRLVSALQRSTHCITLQCCLLVCATQASPVGESCLSSTNIMMIETTANIRKIEYHFSLSIKNTQIQYSPANS